MYNAGQGDGKMYVRWKRRKLRKGLGRKREEDAGHARSAVLVESHRVNGQPRQKFVAHLGSIHERFIGTPLHHRLFWIDVHAKFKRLELDHDQRVAIEQAVERVVPRNNDDGSESEALRELEQKIKGALPR
jgi:hypothetical protein